jgi:hypothetical protein
MQNDVIEFSLCRLDDETNPGRLRFEYQNLQHAYVERRACEVLTSWTSQVNQGHTSQCVRLAIVSHLMKKQHGLAEDDSFHQTREHANELGLRGLQFRAFQLLEHSGGTARNKKDAG